MKPLVNIARLCYVFVLLLLGSFARGLRRRAQRIIWPVMNAGHHQFPRRPSRPLAIDAQARSRTTPKARQRPIREEKLAIGRAFNLIPPDEYARLFDLAIKDHDQAIRARSPLAPRLISAGG